MIILWITNILLPEAILLLDKDCILRGTGGWLVGAANALLKSDEISLSIATPTDMVSHLKVLQGEKITYYLFPLGSGNHKYNPTYEFYLREINEMVKPNVVHIHGTEFTHGLAYIRACGSDKVVASIQGMTSLCWRYKAAGLSKWDIVKHLSLADIFLNQSLFHKTKTLKQCGESEILLIKELKHVIGRTLWDRANTWAINPKIKYHFCNETLRPEFYSGKWSYEKCQNHTIFFNQPTNSIKGFHQLLKALPKVINMYPDTIVYLSGVKHLEPQSIRQKITLPGYVKYLLSEIEKADLSDHLRFLGSLSANEMKREYLNANVFVSCSSIENSSNSICEAQILGTPCISSYVGGISDMIDEGNTGFLYRFEETDTLAYLICKIFSGNVNLEIMSDNEIKAAKLRHDPENNCNTLKQIYKDIMCDE